MQSNLGLGVSLIIEDRVVLAWPSDRMAWRIEPDAARIDSSLKRRGHALGGHEPT